MLFMPNTITETRTEIGLVLKIGGKLFRAFPSDSEDDSLTIKPITEPVNVATEADLDRFLETNQVPKCWEQFEKIGFDLVSDSFNNHGAVVNFTFKDGKWMKVKGGLQFLPNISIVFGRFEVK
jgi:hypothetical protein